MNGRYMQRLSVDTGLYNADPHHALTHQDDELKLRRMRRLKNNR